MLKTKTVLGIDVGSHTVKIVELAQGKNCPELVNYAIVPIPDAFEIDEKDSILRASRVAYILNSVLQEKKIRSDSVAVSISSRSVFARFVKLPFSDKEKLQKLITFEAQQQIPFELEKVHWDYQIVGKNEEGDFEVLIAAIKREILGFQLEAFKDASVNPVIVDIGATALYNSLLDSQIRPEEHVLILDIGANPATLIVHHPEGYWVRSLSFSSQSLTQALMRAFDIGYEEAEALKFQGQVLLDGSAPAGDAEEVGYRINQVITNQVKKLYTEIMRSLSFYRTQFKDIPLERLILSGGGARLTGLSEFLGQKLGVTAEKADPLSGVIVSSSYDEGELLEAPYLFGEAIGLAKRQLGPCKVELNLLSVAASIESIIKQHLRYFYFTMAIMLVTFLIGAWMADIKMSKTESNNKKVLAETHRLSELKRKLHFEVGENTKLVQELKLLEDVASHRKDWLQRYLEIHEMVPKNIYLKNYQPVFKSEEEVSFQRGRSSQESSFMVFHAVPADQEILMLKGNARNRVALDEFKGKLEAIDGVQAVDVKDAEFVDIPETGDNVLNFSLHIGFGENGVQS